MGNVGFRIEEDGTIIRENEPKQPDNKKNNGNGLTWLFIIVIIVITAIAGSYIINYYDESNMGNTNIFGSTDTVYSSGNDSVHIAKRVNENSYDSVAITTEKHDIGEQSQAIESSTTEGAYYQVIVPKAIIYDYYGNSHQAAYFDNKPNGVYYPRGAQVFIEYEYQEYGKITYDDEKGESTRGFIKMCDLQKK